MSEITFYAQPGALASEARIIAGERALRTEAEQDLASPFCRKIAYGFAGIGPLSDYEDGEALKRSTIWRRSIRKVQNEDHPAFESEC